MESFIFCAMLQLLADCCFFKHFDFGNRTGLPCFGINHTTWGWWETLQKAMFSASINLKVFVFLMAFRTSSTLNEFQMVLLVLSRMRKGCSLALSSNPPVVPSVPSPYPLTLDSFSDLTWRWLLLMNMRCKLVQTSRIYPAPKLQV